MPIAIALHFSSEQAVKAEQAKLEQFARRSIVRADGILERGEAALRMLAETTLAPCSAEHIALMRRMTINTSAIDEIGFFADGYLKCTSWGITESVIPYRPPDYVTHDGMEVIVSMRPLVSGADRRMAILYRDHNILIDPGRFVDVIVEPGIRLALGHENGRLIGRLNDPDPQIVESLMERPRTGVLGDHVFAAVQENGWIAIAMQSRHTMLEALHRERVLLLLAGLLGAALIVGLIVWLSRKRLSPLGELAIAVQQREFIVHYQPIIALGTGACVGAEALVRWLRPDGTLVRPDLFIPLAEESGLIQPITDQVVEMIVRDLGDLLRADRSLHIAVNLSAEDIRSGRALTVIGDTLEGTNIHAQQIWLEATERGFIDVEAARETVAHARKLGHAVAIDDFGTGYSSLQYLQNLPLDALKIDKCFVATIATDSATSRVIDHIIDMAKTLDLYIVAEGIETLEQLTYLTEHGVHLGQGWFFSEALSAPEFRHFYGERQATHGREPTDFTSPPSRMVEA